MRVIVLNSKMATQVSPVEEGLGRTVHLRVTSYPNHLPQKFPHEFHATLELRFYDVEESDGDIHREHGINNDVAQQIVSWLRKHADVDTLLINCDAGFSRSPAIALAATEILHLTDEHQRLRELVSRGVYHPNATVYRYLIEAAGLRAQRQEDLEIAFANHE